MSSEGIVVLVLIAIAVGFVLWVRRNSHDYERGEHADNLGGEGEGTRDRK